MWIKKLPQKNHWIYFLKVSLEKDKQNKPQNNWVTCLSRLPKLWKPFLIFIFLCTAPQITSWCNPLQEKGKIAYTDLVAQTFSPTSGHEYKTVLAEQSRVDCLFLILPKFPQAKALMEYLERKSIYLTLPILVQKELTTNGCFRTTNRKRNKPLNKSVCNVTKCLSWFDQIEHVA